MRARVLGKGPGKGRPAHHSHTGGADEDPPHAVTRLCLSARRSGCRVRASVERDEHASSCGLGGATAALTHGTPVDDGGANFTTTRNLQLQSFAPRAARHAERRSATSSPTSRSGATRPTRARSTASGSSTSTTRADPKVLLDYDQCANPNGAGQGDVVVWGSILVRTLGLQHLEPGRRPATASRCRPATPGRPPPLGNGFEGLHVFDVSDPGNPDLVASVDLKCGSHTATGVPDLRNRRLLVYSTPSNAALRGHRHRRGAAEPAGGVRGAAASSSPTPRRAPRTTSRAMTRPSSSAARRKAACAGGVGYAVWSLGGKDGGSLDNPRFLYSDVVEEIAVRPRRT